MSSDDINIVRRMCEGGNGVFHDACLSICDEIVRLRAEVERIEGQRKLRADLAYLMKAERDDEKHLADQLAYALKMVLRLRAAGDALAATWPEEDQCGCSNADCLAVVAACAAWKEARREQ